MIEPKLLSHGPTTCFSFLSIFLSTLALTLRRDIVISCVKVEDVDLEIKLVRFFPCDINGLFLEVMGILFIVIYYWCGADSVGIDSREMEKGWGYGELDFTSHIEKGNQRNQLWAPREEVNG